MKIKFFLQLTSLVLLVSQLSPTFGLAATLPAKEVAEIKKFTSLENGKGQLLNPPRGSIKPEVLVVRDYVKNLVIELIGPQLKEKNINFVINVYGNNSMNAWVQQLDPNDGNSDEAKWKKENPGEVWPLRKAWGIPDDGKSIYEIGVTTALLTKLDYKDELAFILGHETTHLLEGHTDHSESNSDAFKKWWSSQSHEAVADHLGVDKIIGKYELDAALSVMEKLHPKTTDQMSLSDALQAGTSDHHAEGVRISAIQFYIEYLRRFNLNAHSRQLTDIPASMKLNVYGRSEKIDYNGTPAAREAYFKLLDDLLSDSSNVEIFKKDNSGFNFDDKKEVDPFENLIGNPNRLGFAKLLYETTQKLEASNSSKVAKMNAFIKAMVFVGTRASSYYDESEDWFYGLSPREKFEMLRFLVSNSVGEGAWSVKDYKEVMAKLPYKARTYIEAPFIRTENGQNIFLKLIQTSKVWSDLLGYWASMDSFFRNNQYESLDIGHHFNVLDDGEMPAGKIRDFYRKKLLPEFANIKNPQALMSKVDQSGLSEFRYIVASVNPNRSVDSQKWSQAILDARKKFMSISQKLILEQMINLFKKTDKSPQDNLYIGFAMDSIDYNSLDEAGLSRLQDAYDIYIDQILNPVRTQRTRDRVLLTRESYNLTTQLIQKSYNDHDYLLKYLRYILLATEPNYFREDGLPQTTLDILKNLCAQLTKEDIFNITERISELEKTVWQEVHEISQKLKANEGIELYSHLVKVKDPEERKAIVQKVMSWELSLNTNYRLHVNLLQFITFYGDFDKSPFQQFNFSDLSRFLRSFEIAKRMKRFDTMDRFDIGAPQATARGLFNIFYHVFDSIPTFEQQLKTYSRILKISGPAFMPTAEEEHKIREIFSSRLKKLTPADQVQWLKSEVLRKALGGEIVGETIAEYVFQITKNDRRRLRTEVDRVLKTIPLKEKWPDAFAIFRNNLSEKAQIQPAEIKTVFAEDTRTITEQVDLQGNLIRGMSSFSTFTRSMPANEQLEMIEFIMGRSVKMPKTLAEFKEDRTQGKVDVKQMFFKLREEMKFRTPLERSMVVNSVLTGPNGLPATPAGLTMIHDHLLKAISSENKGIAELLLKALSEAEGRNKSLILSYALAQKVEGTETENGLTEAIVLRSLLDFYGVPGVKLAQYLAFTNEFKNFQSALEVYQDAAMPISYYDALLLVIKRLGPKWDPEVFRITRIIGSGSVNIAIEYENLITKKLDVVSIARDEIEIKTKEDFRRFEILFQKLSSDPKNRKKFEFVIGLMELIQRSVTLEFDKPHSYKMQKQVQKLYRQKIDGWNIQSIDAYSVEGMAIFMEKAPGIGARKVLKNDPASYESAMRAFMQVEYKVLRGVNETDNWIPIELHANPDVHDGQIMIDVANRTVTILDFGQAIEITNSERDFALDILRIISKAESTDSVIELVQKYYNKPNLNLNKRELTKILKSDDHMDVFIHLLSFLGRANVDVPLSTVHWVLAANRLIKLGEKIRISPEASIKWMLVMKKIGLPLTAFNAGKDIKDTFDNHVSSAVHKIESELNSCREHFK